MERSSRRSPDVSRLENGVRARFVSCLAILFESPRDWPADLLDRLAVSLEPLPYALRHAGQLLLEQLRHLKDTERLDLAHARLFLGPIEVLAPPYASHYLEVDGQLMGSVSQSVERAYFESGLLAGDGPREAPDHASRELEFYAFLLAQCARTGTQLWVRRLHGFRVHIGEWWPTLAARIEASEERTGLGQLGRVLALFCESETARFERA